MKILNIAHRGYSGKFDENTMIAFRKAIEYKADGIETDVQLSKDGIPVIIHDETLDRTTDGHGFVKDYTLKELKAFRTKSVPRVQALKGEAIEGLQLIKEIDSPKLGEYTLEEVEYFKNNDGEEIPTLRDLLELFSASDLKILNLELKNSIFEYDELEEKVINMIDEYNLRDRVIISTFNHMSLVKIRELEKQEIEYMTNHQVETLKDSSNTDYKNKNTKLKNDKTKSKSKMILGALTDSTLANVPKYLDDIDVECYHPCFYSILNKSYMKEIKDAGIKVNPYTVNETEYMKMVIEAGADSIITNEVEKLNDVIKSFYNIDKQLGI
ncbi:glycerophosphodiester phosphodiesterase family protein [Clostridium saccharobutylicum]|uniref:Putative glycerophosphoryl diester phosphodiesterase 1 n=1 Tax=Clostridium saccharobutylicum TaxID=169679 RepID=A0A1S8NJF1_CLOSA|nr:glycerophosphodiester phosphodiesterase family protein [Clostridium saccharobutylicum]OOM16502.1 putative glycerophosphoryl diester phosphodiesterase 1 [Clostridium saccharobutylicum]